MEGLHLQEGIQLEGLVAGLDGGLGSRAILLGGAAAEEPAVGVEPDAVPQLAAQQVVDRAPQGLPLDIPQGNVHAAQGHRRQAPRPQVGVAPVVLLPQLLALKGVLAQQALAQHLDGPGAQEAAAAGRVAGLPPSMDAFIGVDADEGPGPPRKPRRWPDTWAGPRKPGRR